MGTACTLKFQQVVCGTELSSQIHLTLSTNHSLILLIIQSLAQLCIPGFQFSIFVSRSQTPAGKNKSNNTNLCSREIVNLDPLPNQSFSKRQPLSILALSILGSSFTKRAVSVNHLHVHGFGLNRVHLPPLYIKMERCSFQSSGISLHFICFMDPIRILSLSQRGKSPGRVGKSCHWQCIQNLYLLMEKSLKTGPP